MSDAAEPRVITSAAELISDIGVTIQGITFFSLIAELNEDDAATRVDEISPSYGLRVRSEDNELIVRLATTLEAGLGRIVVDAAITYILNADAEFSEDVRLEFANEVGIMALLPYVRQAIADLSQRVFGEVVLMPVMPRGTLWFTADDREPPPV
ncbi:hypothetical protein [Microbacterium aurum]